MNLYETAKRIALPVVAAASLAYVAGCSNTAIMSNVRTCDGKSLGPCITAPAPETTYVIHSGTVRVDVYEHGRHSRNGKGGDASHI